MIYLAGEILWSVCLFQSLIIWVGALIISHSVVLDVEECVRREDVCLVLRDEHGRHPPDEELAVLEGDGAPEVGPILVAHHALKQHEDS